MPFCFLTNIFNFHATYNTKTEKRKGKKFFIVIGPPVHPWKANKTQNLKQINDVITNKNNTANLNGVECGLHACNNVTVKL